VSINLTDEQKIILDRSNENIYVSASPGSGKSTMLSYIAEKLLQDENNFVLLVTFTNKAAKSIISKCEQVDQNRIIGGTFHGLANSFIRKNGISWNICDEGKKRLIIKKLFDCKKDKEKFNEILDKINKDKSQWPYVVSDQTALYNTEMVKYNLVDFDDMIYNFITTCSSLNFPAITHVLVDELQDTSGPQLEMLKQLQLKVKCNMIGVSDDDQCIYSWRGARPENVSEFIKVFNCSVLNMGYNFRSCKSIVECSSKLIEHNKSRIKKTIRPFKTESGTVISYQSQSVFTEIDYTVLKCKQNINKEIAILYRNRTYKNYLEFELKKAGLKYCVNDALDICDRSAIKVMMSCMKLASNIGDIYDLEIASKGIKGIGKTTVEKLKKESQNIPLISVLRNKFIDPKQCRRLTSLISICNWFDSHRDSSLDLLAIHIETLFIKSFDYQEYMKTFILDITKCYKVNASDIRDLCNDLGLDGKEEHNDENATIELSTTHGWKGKEADVVILPWCQQYLDTTVFHNNNIEEDRRLFYVAITRAKEKLYMSYCGNKPRFISEMGI